MNQIDNTISKVTPTVKKQSIMNILRLTNVLVCSVKLTCDFSI